MSVRKHRLAAGVVVLARVPPRRLGRERLERRLGRRQRPASSASTTGRCSRRRGRTVTQPSRCCSRRRTARTRPQSRRWRPRARPSSTATTTSATCASRSRPTRPRPVNSIDASSRRTSTRSCRCRRPSPDASQPAQPQPAPGAGTPNDNPYMPVGETGSSAFRAAHPDLGRPRDHDRHRRHGRRPAPPVAADHEHR